MENKHGPGVWIGNQDSRNTLRITATGKAMRPSEVSADPMVRKEAIKEFERKICNSR